MAGTTRKVLLQELGRGFHYIDVDAFPAGAKYSILFCRFISCYRTKDPWYSALTSFATGPLNDKITVNQERQLQE
jgi:hypothetical protein